ncbi:hypothetical protein KI688_004235 [Linnemannia hyalina]|uniref:Uncharacterized protein n=1 Tax=Linnemannia hyalina TaxID=64524 RepID=A0A9P8BPN7_9FUNG|nr:hypothetical protein KI688_004235 [Linnemannia hyalina]
MADIILALAEGMVAEEEEMLNVLLDLNNAPEQILARFLARPRPIFNPPQRNYECRILFRFEYDHILLIMDALHFPPFVAQKKKMPGLEALCVVLNRLAYPKRYIDQREMFAINFMFDTWAHIMVFDHVRLMRRKLEFMADHALDNLWTGAAQDLLKSLGEKGTFIRNRMSKFSSNERMEIWRDAIQDRQYRRDLRTFTHRQMKSQVADMTSESEAQSTLERDLDKAKTLPIYLSWKALTSVKRSSTGNYVWHTATALPGINDHSHRSICNSINGLKIRLSPSEVLLCIELGRELSDAGKIRSRAVEDDDEERIVPLFQTLANKLSVEAMSWAFKNEDGFARDVLDAIFTQLFPEGRAPYEVIWANCPSEASKLRRGESLKADGTVMKEGFNAAYPEAKGPKYNKCQSKYLEDFWDPSSFGEDCIESDLRARRSIRVVPVVQVFGRKVALYIRKFLSELYILRQVSICYLPRDLQDMRGMIQCIEAFRALKRILDALDLHRYVRTPPRLKEEDLLPYDQFLRPTNVSPTSRPFFPKTA